MPEEKPESNDLVDGENANKNNETEEFENFQFSMFHKVRDIVENFFSRHPTKHLRNEIGYRRLNHAEPISMDTNTRSGLNKSFFNGKSDQSYKISVNDNRKSFGINLDQDNEKSSEWKSLAFENLLYDACTSAIRSEISQIKDNEKNKNDIEMKGDENKVFREKGDKQECTVEINKVTSNLQKSFLKENDNKKPEETPENKNLVDCENANKNNEAGDLENHKYFTFQKVRNVVQNFLSRQRTKHLRGEIGYRKINHAAQTAMSTNTRSGRNKGFFKAKNNQRSQFAANDNQEIFGMNQVQDNEKSSGKLNHAFEKLENTSCTSAVKSEKSQIKNNEKNKNVSEKKDEQVLKEGGKKECAAEKTEMNGIMKFFRINRRRDNVKTSGRISHAFENPGYATFTSAIGSNDSQIKDNKNNHHIVKEEDEFKILKEKGKKSEWAVEKTKVKTNFHEEFLKNFEKNDQRSPTAVNVNHKPFRTDQDNGKSLRWINPAIQNVEYPVCTPLIRSEESQINDKNKNDIGRTEDGFKALREKGKKTDCAAERSEVNTNIHKNFLKEKDKDPQITVNGNGPNKSFGINRHQDNAASPESVNPTFKNLKFIECACATKPKVSQSRNKNEINIPSKEDEFKTSKENKESEFSTERNKRSNTAASRSGRSEIKNCPQISSKVVHRRHSEPPERDFLIQRMLRDDDRNRRARSTNIPVESKEFTEDDLKNSIKFGSNQSLMSGGAVVPEGFADYFKIPNYYDTSSEEQTTEEDSLENSFSKTLISRQHFTGGEVTDCSSVGISLEELFSSKRDTSHRKFVKQQFSGGQMASSFSSEKTIFVNVQPSKITIHEINASNSGLNKVLRNQSSGSDNVSESRNNATRETRVIEKSGSDCSLLPVARSHGNSNALHSIFEPSVSRSSERSSKTSSKGRTAYGA